MKDKEAPDYPGFAAISVSQSLSTPDANNSRALPVTGPCGLGRRGAGRHKLDKMKTPPLLDRGDTSQWRGAVGLQLDRAIEYEPLKKFSVGVYLPILS